jgi:hypothetical protein
MKGVVAGLLAGVLLACLPAPALAWDEAGYWEFADKLSRRLDDTWNPELGRYRPGSSSVDAMMNANMLLLHSAAALYGHEGASRQDERARSIAAQLMGSPPWLETVVNPPRGSHPHEPGWVASMTDPQTAQHLVVDGEVTDGLAMAWQAKDALGLDPAVQALMQDRLRRVAEGPYWRYPTLILNQVNWYGEVYNAAALATGNPIYLQRDLRGQFTALVNSIRSPVPNTAGTLGPGMQFHYIPHGLPTSKLNIESAEYANIVASVVRFYDSAIARGMQRLPTADEALLRRWMTRVLAGYWTHGGYMNWDTGFSFGRWHQMKKFALSQQALIGIAAGGRLSPSRAQASWAKHILETGFELYERKLPDDGDGVAPGLFYPLKPKPQSNKQAIFAASRMAANAARAVAAGLAARSGSEPPALYSFDAATGRLAVTTPRYNTAITAVTNGAYPYGGIDLARLYDGRQEIAATLGARVPASFGIVARNRHGRIRLATSRPASSRAGRPLRLLRAPSGVGSAGSILRPFAGPFDVLRVTGRRAAGGVDARATYTFRRNSIIGAWTIRATTRRRRSVEALFPSTGGARAAVWALLRDGQAVQVSEPRPVQGVAAFYVQSERSGYVVEPLDRVKGATVSLVQPRRQPSAPDPGPTLSVRLTGRLARKRPVHFSVRMTPAADLAEAGRTAGL